MTKREIEQYGKKVAKIIADAHPELEVRYLPKLKNNNVKIHYVSLIEPGSNIAPSFVIEKFVQGGISVEEAAENIYKVYVSTIENNLGYTASEQLSQIILNYDKVKEHIYPALRSAKRNENLLEKVVSLDFMNLKETFALSILSEKDGEMCTNSTVITKELAEIWGVTAEELKIQAEANTTKSQHAIENASRITKTYAMSHGVPLEIVEMIPELPMYFLSTETMLNGSMYLTDTARLNDIMKAIGPFRIIPASVDILALVCDDADITDEEMKQMVYDVNKKDVPEDEILEDCVYYFDGTLKQL